MGSSCFRRTAGYARGGIATYTKTIAPELAGRGHEVHVLSCAPGNAHSDETSGGVRWHRRPVHPLPVLGKLSRMHWTQMRFGVALACARESRRLGEIDVIESPEWMAQSLLLGSSRPVVVNLHTSIGMITKMNGLRLGIDKRTADRLERISAARAKLVTSPSTLLARTLVDQGWLRSTPEIVPLPVALSARPTRTADATPPEILVVGRLEPRKAPELAIEAAAILASDVPDLRVTFVGRNGGERDGTTYRDWLTRLANQRGVNARFIEAIPQEDMHEVYAGSRVVCVPSRFESFSMALVEALAAARPVVCTSGVGAAEILATGGGDVVDADPRTIARALAPFLIDAGIAARVGAEGRAAVEQACDPDVIARRREACYQDVVEKMCKVGG